MKVIREVSLSIKSCLMISTIALLLAGCTESATDTSNDSDKPESESSKEETAKLAPHAWKQHFDEANEFFQAHRYHDMVRTLEVTKKQAKSELGDTLEWGLYCLRLAKAHSWAIEYQAAADNAKEALQLFDKLQAPVKAKYSANWFAGISLASLKKYDQALPYLKTAQALSKDPDAGVGESTDFLYQKLEDCYRQNKDTVALQAVQKEKRTRLRH